MGPLTDQRSTVNLTGPRPGSGGPARAGYGPGWASLGRASPDTWQLLVMPCCPVDLNQNAPVLWAWLMVSVNQRFTGVRGVYGGPCSPFLPSSWSMAHLVHELQFRLLLLLHREVARPPAASGRFWPRRLLSSVSLGSAKNFSARPCLAKWPA